MKKKWLVIDAHTHFLPQEAVAKTGIAGGVDYRAFFKGDMSLGYAKLQDIETSVRVMEEAGIDMGVLAQSAWSTQGLEVCKALNDGYARIKREYPGKFILCGHVPLQGGKETVDEVERCISELGLQGISLPSSVTDVFLDSPELWPMYAKINELDVPIVIHPSVRTPIWGGGKKYNQDRGVSREYDIAKACVEVLYGVFKDFPNLKFLFPHYGGGMPVLKARLKCQFQPTPGAKFVPKTPSELEESGFGKAFDELFDKLYFDLAGAGGGWAPVIKAGWLTLRADRQCFGTDYPFDMYTADNMKRFIDVIKNLDIPENDKRLMLGENIKRLFKI